MPRRPLLLTVALSTTLLLTGCNNSPEAGRPNTAPTSSSPTSTPTASPTATANQEDQAAIAAATARYRGARAAMDQAMSDPAKATKAALTKAGIGGNWMITVWDDVTFERQNGWYRTGAVEVVSASPASVTLTGEQPKVLLTVCLDTSKVTTRFQSTKKPVPLGPSNGKRHKAQASMTYAPPAGQATKSWFLIDEKDLGSC